MSEYPIEAAFFAVFIVVIAIGIWVCLIRRPI